MRAFILIPLFLLSITCFSQNKIFDTTCNAWISEFNLGLSLKSNSNDSLNQYIESTLKDKGYQLMNKVDRMSWNSLSRLVGTENEIPDNGFYISIFDRFEINTLLMGLFNLSSLREQNIEPLLMSKYQRQLHEIHKYTKAEYKEIEALIKKFIGNLQECEIREKAKPSLPKKIVKLIQENNTSYFEHSSCRTWVFEGHTLRNSKMLTNARLKMLKDKGYKVINESKDYSKERLYKGEDEFKRNDLIIPIFTDKIQKFVQASVFPYYKVKTHDTWLETNITWLYDKNNLFTTRKVKFKNSRNIRNKKAIDTILENFPNCKTLNQGYNKEEQDKEFDFAIRNYEVKACINEHKDYLARFGQNTQIENSLLVLEEVERCDSDQFQGIACLPSRYFNYDKLTEKNRKVFRKMMDRMGIKSFSKLMVNYITDKKLCSRDKKPLHEISAFKILKNARRAK